jgi:PTS system mannose-specific IIA component
MIHIIVITHGQFGQELLRTAQDIAGRQDGVAALPVTPEMGQENVAQALHETLERLGPSDGTLILVDMLGGTPCNTALLSTKDVPAEILTGVNLYMILSSFTHRDTMDLKTLTAKVAEDGKRAIVAAKALLLKRLG